MNLQQKSPKFSPIDPMDPFLDIWDFECNLAIVDIAKQYGLKWNLINPLRYGCSDDPVKNPICIYIAVTSEPLNEEKQTEMAAKIVENVIQPEDSMNKWSYLAQIDGAVQTHTLIVKTGKERIVFD